MNANTHLTAGPVRRDPDHTIDRALSALRDAHPRPGLEGRILASLEHRETRLATNPGGPSFYGLIVKGWGIARGSARENVGRIALWPATSAAILAIASLLILHQQVRPPGLAAHFSPLNAPSTSNPALAPAHTPLPISRHPERSASARSRRTPVFASCADEQSTGCPIHRGGATVGMGGVSTSPADAQALADLHAPSHPAPPLPLTSQEKLFLRALRYANATQLAELDPIVRAKQAADETAAFKSFFPDPPPLKQPLGDPE